MKRAEIEELLTEINEVRHRYGHLRFYQVCPDWCSSGVWAPTKLASIALGFNIDRDELGISERTRRQLAKWHDSFDAERPEQMWTTPGSLSHFDAEGVNVAMSISADIGDDTLIEYHVGDTCLLFCAGKCVAACPVDPSSSGGWRGTDD